MSTKECVKHGAKQEKQKKRKRSEQQLKLVKEQFNTIVDIPDRFSKQLKSIQNCVVNYEHDIRLDKQVLEFHLQVVRSKYMLPFTVHN